MKVALAVWKGRISPVFDVSRHILVLDIEKGAVAGKIEETCVDDNPAHRVCKMARLKVQTLICGAVSQGLAGMLAAYDIKTIPFVAGDVEEVIDAYLAGNLPNPNLSMPGCCGRRGLLRGSISKERLTKNGFGKGKQSRIRKEEETMPGGDRTGPQGKGPGTGKGLGRCGKQGRQGFAKKSEQNQGQGAGLRQGSKRGLGQGSGRGASRTK